MSPNHTFKCDVNAFGASELCESQRTKTQQDFIFDKMIIDADILNYTHSHDGITFSVTKSGVPCAPYTVSIACGSIEFSRSITTYPEFQALINVGLGYFLGVFDDIDSLVPEFFADMTE